MKASEYRVARAKAFKVWAQETAVVQTFGIDAMKRSGA
jgi:hypothetical protein